MKKKRKRNLSDLKPYRKLYPVHLKKWPENDWIYCDADGNIFSFKNGRCLKLTVSYSRDISYLGVIMFDNLDKDNRKRFCEVAGELVWNAIRKDKPLKDNETVWNIDGDPLNNAITNLVRTKKNNTQSNRHTFMVPYVL